MFILDNQLENAKTGKSILPDFTYVGPGYWQKSRLLQALSNITNLILARW